jgi:hypothetical protein
MGSWQNTGEAVSCKLWQFDYLQAHGGDVKVIVDLVRREITGLELMYELSRKEKKNRG